jgi:TonB family protein
MAQKKIQLILPVLFAVALVCTAAPESGKKAAAKPGTASAAASTAGATSDTKDGDFVDAELVDTPPVAEKQVVPQATRIAIQGHVSGIVLLRVLVDANGAPEKVDILRDTAPKVGLGDASKAALEQWRWKPATKDGHRVKTWIALQVPFKN